MSIIKRHPIVFAVLSFIILTLPGALNAWWSLWGKIKGVEMPSLNFGWLNWLLPILGLILFTTVILQARKSTATVMSDYDNESTEYGNILRKMMDEDIHKPAYCMDVRASRVVFDHIRDKAGPYLVFEFQVHSSSVYKIRFNTEPKGHIIYENQELKDSPEYPLGSWMSQKPTLSRKETGTIELRQFLLPEIANSIIDMSNTKTKTKHVSFNFSQLYIMCDVINPNGDTGTTWRCWLPQNVSFTLPVDGSIAFPT
ncbi:hypothetical protein ACFLVH_02465 [Chloroflexota bacterium]